MLFSVSSRREFNTLLDRKLVPMTPSFFSSSCSSRSVTRLQVVACVLACLIAGARAQAETLLNQDFRSSARDTQALPQSTAWFCSSNSRYLSAGEKGLTLQIGSVSRFLLGYFTETQPVEIPEGGSLKVRIVFRVEEPQNSDTGFRFGIFHSGETRIATDGLPKEDPAFRNYVGYAVSSNFLPSSGRHTSVRKRSPGLDDNLILEMAKSYEKLTAKEGGAVTIDPEKERVAELTLSRNGAEVSISYRLSQDGQPIVESEALDSKGAITAFDTIAFSALSKTCQSLTIENMTISLEK